MSLRDLISGEKSIQAFLNVYLGISNLYIIHSEKELNKGYADLVLVPFLARYAGIKYSYLMEIKYLKSGANRGGPGVQELINTAEQQLKTYSIDEKFRKNIEKTRLIKLVLRTFSSGLTPFILFSYIHQNHSICILYICCEKISNKNLKQHKR